MPKVKLFKEEEVLGTITQLFWTKGYNGTSIDELVNASGLSRSSLYDTFGGKHELFLKSLQHYLQQTNEALEQELQNISSPKKKIEYFFRFAVNDILNDKKRKGCFMVNSSTELCNIDKKVAGMAVNNMENVTAQFAQWIKAGQKSGEISNTQPAGTLSVSLYASFCGMQVMGQSSPDKKLLDNVVKGVMQLLG
jgi:TetR/AcrR family transcriptional regulator, transcriptional repressor for nem operon